MSCGTIRLPPKDVIAGGNMDPKLKVVVVGTSNSATKFGYVSALKVSCDVQAVVSGRKPVFGVIQSILANINLIRECDVLVLDHYVNDMAIYAKKIPPEIYRPHIQNLYSLLSLLGTPVVNLLLPIRGVEEEDAHLRFIRESSLQHGFMLLDLNRAGFFSHHFKDDLHLRHHVAYLVGMRLSEALRFTHRSDVIDARRPFTPPDNMPYVLFDAEDIATANERQTSEYSNSLLSINYLIAEQSGIKIPISSKCNLPVEIVSIGMLNKDADGDCSAAKIDVGGSSRFIAIDEIGYFHEYLDPAITVFSDPVIFSGTIEDEYRFLFDRRPPLPAGTSKPQFNICEVMAFTGGRLPNRWDMPKGHEINLPTVLDDVLACLDSINLHELNPNHSNLVINTLRDIALGMDDTQATSRLRIMQCASKMRPSGGLLKQKIQEYLQIGFEKERLAKAKAASETEGSDGVFGLRPIPDDGVRGGAALRADGRTWSVWSSHKHQGGSTA